jgi:YebC/PmpR family DNA-binding regulatory protein
MSGHSKWSKVKHQKAVTDVVKGAAFTKAARAITIAVMEGGRVGNPDMNFHLRLAVEKARDVNVPKENIERAIQKGLGIGADTIEQVLYEGYGPHGVAVLVDTATDNKTRTVAQLKNYFDTAGGRISSPGSVSYLFSRSGILTVSTAGLAADRIFESAVDAGADDVTETADVFEIYCHTSKLSAVRAALVQKGIAIDNTTIIMKPNTPVEYSPDILSVVESFVDGLSALDDVQTVYTNAGG